MGMDEAELCVVVAVHKTCMCCAEGDTVIVRPREYHCAERLDDGTRFVGDFAVIAKVNQ